MSNTKFDAVLGRVREEDTIVQEVIGGSSSSTGPIVGSTDWGTITGTLADQLDLQAALDLKANLSLLAGGNTGEVLTKDSNVDQDYSWQAIPATTVTTVDTKANILALTPSSPQTALATDTGELFFYDGTNWKVHPIKVSTELANPDAGYTQDSNKRGYGDDYIYGKKLYATGIGDFTDTPFEGAIKVDQDFTPAKYQIYLRGKWNTLFYDLTMENGDFEHVPQTYSIDVRSGNSNTTGLNGQPIIREYKVDAGAYPREVIIDGGVL